ncbi:MAG: hypothetical protein MR762_02645 [Clostridiales bacterium]|nr:hypothetical protein [Clostridiales bacterium]
MKEQKSEVMISPEAENAAPEYHFSQQSEKQRCGNYWFDEDGQIHVKNLSAYWIPQLTITEEISGTLYTVTGSFEGTESLIRKLERITGKKFTEKVEDSQ